MRKINLEKKNLGEKQTKMPQSRLKKTTDKFYSWLNSQQKEKRKGSKISLGIIDQGIDENH